jgi:hypothetical protein
MRFPWLRVKQAKRILHYPLRSGTTWCGGLAVYDALIVLAWLVVNVLYVQQRKALKWPLFKGALSLTRIP